MTPLETASHVDAFILVRLDSTGIVTMPSVGTPFNFYPTRQSAEHEQLKQLLMGNRYHIYHLEIPL